MSAPERPQRPPDRTFGYDTFLSPFTYKYGTAEMRGIWSLQTYWLTARDLWIEDARAKMEVGLVFPEQVRDLQNNRNNLSVDRILELEDLLGHDVVAAMHEYSEIAPVGGEILHRGLTSEDILSNVEMIQILDSFNLLRPRLQSVIGAFGDRIEQHLDTTGIGFTHIQAAEPIIYAYRLAKYAQDFIEDLDDMDYMVPRLKTKGLKGPVGTSAALQEMMLEAFTTARQHETKVMDFFGLNAALITDQTYPRKNLFRVVAGLAGIAQSIHRFAFDVQILQSTPFGEVSEPKRKVGSSAMPHKKNPVNSENADSLTELLAGNMVSAWITASFVNLERTLRDSGGKREYLPVSFMAVEEGLKRVERVVKGMTFHLPVIEANFRRYAPFAVTEPLTDQLTAAGMDRKEAHEMLREHAERAFTTIQEGGPNIIRDLILGDERITERLGGAKIREVFVSLPQFVGDAKERSLELLEEKVKPAVAKFVTY